MYAVCVAHTSDINIIELISLFSMYYKHIYAAAPRGFGARAARGRFISFASPKETNQRKRAPGAPSSAVPSRGVSQTIKPFVSLRASVRLDGMEKPCIHHWRTWFLAGYWAIRAGFYIRRHTGDALRT
nr:hypothetical protein [uncultured Deefgea sp.]